jgi:hypothetical protein
VKFKFEKFRKQPTSEQMTPELETEIQEGIQSETITNEIVRFPPDSPPS